MSDDQTVTDALNRLDRALTTDTVSVGASDLAFALVHVERLRATVFKLRVELTEARQTITARGDTIEELRETIERLSA